MSVYQKRHYEDVARALKENRAWAIRMDSPHARGVMASTIGTFADLFAADNPKRCSFHGEHDGKWNEDCKVTGFDREQFLKACGLEPEYTATRAMQELGVPDPEDIPLAEDEQLEEQPC